MKERKFTLELSGPPASGKTTFINVLKDWIRHYKFFSYQTAGEHKLEITVKRKDETNSWEKGRCSLCRGTGKAPIGCHDVEEYYKE